MFRRYAAGVVVIAADAGNGPVDFTATSLVSVSLLPPLVSFSIATTASDRAAEFLEVAYNLWDSWEDDATLADKASGVWGAGAADGFNIMPAVLPSGLEAFTDHVVPILQQRGLFRTDYTRTTLRDHYGLPRPIGRLRTLQKAVS
ncbi:flavin reductase [Kribbella sp. CA-294648]|uniref:flavin reductase family protein n=1 Tax=Kribbella sp. CA-294648 TaxID=3239948 RepID=UPI003D89F452